MSAAMRVSALPPTHPLVTLTTAIEAAGGALVYALGPIADAPPVPTVYVELAGQTFTVRAPTYRQAAALLEPAISPLLSRKDL